MPEVITFDEAINATKGKDRTLLVGNGFSAKYFAYKTLLAASGIAEGSALRNVFDALQTVDFEKVVRAIENAAIVEAAYGHEERAADLRKDAQKVREALVQAVKATHPAHREDFDYGSSAAFLRHFNTVFSLNYDLLLYWTILEETKLRDGFGLGTQIGRFLGPFREDAHCAVYNLHGGLHLFADKDGEIIKALHTGEGVVATIADTIERKQRLPVYVAEGTSRQKIHKIESMTYLRHCYAKLRENAANVFIYGHSADENDEHVYRAIFESDVKHVFFGIYQPNPDKLKLLDGQLAKYQKVWGKDTKYEFYDSESAKVWDA
ncbi:DUF4917 family protein [Mesorhizobium sp.]|uniref:DUF4917 family protein n=1 Tax=Mesorhizobium sp. TaxID=1871066 RepID=UPI000FE6D216|nr:DUF4917 family protein [Mesorhizobium sp.]RWO24450.1 MAG: DUF4917 family protein [Mesorhizobium sp.]